MHTDTFHSPIITLGGKLTSMHREKRVSVWELLRVGILKRLGM